MAVGTSEGNLAVKVLGEYVKDFQKRNPTLRVFSCYLHQDEATPHLHIDFVPYVINWKGKGYLCGHHMKVRVQGSEKGTEIPAGAPVMVVGMEGFKPVVAQV